MRTRHKRSRLESHKRRAAGVTRSPLEGNLTSPNPRTADTAEGPPVTSRKIDALSPSDHNARTHSPKQIRQIGDSIREFGFTNPILIDEQGKVLAGHGRLKAAKALGMTEVPTIRIDHLSETQKRAYMLADNRIAELAGWDSEVLAIEFQNFIDLDFDIEITGFTMGEIDLLIDPPDCAKSDIGEDNIPDLDSSQPPVSRRGDLWRLGRHRLLCGDALSVEDFAHLMATDKAQMIITDPPFNVPITGHVGGSGRIHHPEFLMASGEMSEPEFTVFLERVFRNLSANSVNGSIHFVFMDWRHLREILTAARIVYSELKNVCVWNKDNAGMGSFYRSKHELIFVFKNGKRRHINNFGLGDKGRHRTNVWDYPGGNTMHPDRMSDLEMHPTVKPAALVADAILDCSKRNGLILDCFAGSGTTIIAAEAIGRRAHAMELDPRYVDAALRRWSEQAGEEPILEESGDGYVEVERRRRLTPRTENPNRARKTK